MVELKGYAGKIARVDLSSGEITHIPTLEYAEKYIGGRGIAAKIYWDEVSPQVSALSPENRLIFITGPLAGFTRLSGSRWQVCGKSPVLTPECFSYCNLGGSWGSQLKLAGYDGLVVQGRAERPVYLHIQDGAIEVRDASSLWGLSSVKVREALKEELGSHTRVVATGPAGDNQVVMASLLADEDSSGSSGFGAVMGSKRLKAIAVRGSGRVTPAYPKGLRELRDYVFELTKPAPGAASGTERPGMKKVACFGCIRGCSRGNYESQDGQKGKFMCQSSLLYQDWAMRYYQERNDVPFLATRACDEYGLNTMAIGALLVWLRRCFRAGILTDESTDLPLSKMGSLEFIQALTRDISLRQGFGDVLARGILEAARIVGHGSAELLADYISPSGDAPTYGPRMFIATGILYMVEPRQPIQQLHEISRLVGHWARWTQKQPDAYISSDVIRAIARRFWGSELAADFSTYEGKALAARMIQDRQYAKECLILCDLDWPLTSVKLSEDHVGDPTLESRILSAVTGMEVDEAGLYRIGERALNLQRAILTREGHGGREHDKLPEFEYMVPLKAEVGNLECLTPGKDGEVISKKGAVVDRGKFRELQEEFYQLRGWDVATGFQTGALLESLGLEDVAQDLEARHLLAQ